MNKKKYLMMCSELGTEPKEEEIPADYADFPKIVQDAISIYGILPDVYDGFSGTFFGKNYSILPYLTEKIYNIDDHRLLMQILLLINNIVSTNRANKQKAEQKKAKRKHK